MARGLDVAVLRDCHVGVPQDSLDSFVGDSKLVKICRQPFDYCGGFSFCFGFSS